MRTRTIIVDRQDTTCLHLIQTAGFPVRWLDADTAQVTVNGYKGLCRLKQVLNTYALLEEEQEGGTP